VRKPALPTVFIIATESEQTGELKAILARAGFDCLVTPDMDNAMDGIASQSRGVMLLDMDEARNGSEAWENAQMMRQQSHIPLIALVAGDKLNGMDSSVDDFVVKPGEANEIAARIRRLLSQKEGIDGKHTIRCGDLVIDPARYKVSLGGKPVTLTFKEYQLLKFLASNQGKVFSREALLNKVWGWDYYGGDRTVDVHIRRLRSKIEDPTHSFIETVRNIGYRLRDDL
jgi:DNA-binding response OmpR family regulator